MNNNPFEPVAPEPAELTQTDNEPDNFLSEDDGDIINVTSKPSRPNVMLDGVSPMQNLSDADGGTDGPIDSNAIADAVSDTSSSLETNALVDAPDDSLTDEPSDDGKFLDSAAETATETDNLANLDSALTAAAAISDEKSKNNAKKGNGGKPAKQLKISLLTIVLFVLTLAGIGGSVFFYLQNQANLDKLDTAEAKVAQLTNSSSESATSENKSANQYDALQDKITDLTQQNADKQKTLDENKKTIDGQTTKINTLTKSNEDLTTKVQNISDLTTRLDTMLKKLEGIYQ